MVGGTEVVAVQGGRAARETGCKKRHLTTYLHTISLTNVLTTHLGLRREALPTYNHELANYLLRALGCVEKRYLLTTTN